MFVQCLITGLYKNYPDQQLVSSIEAIYVANDYLNGYAVTTPMMELFGDNWRDINIQVNEFNKYCISSDIGQYLSYLKNVVIDNINEVYHDSYASKGYKNSICRLVIEMQRCIFMWIKMGHVYCIYLLSTIVLVKKWVKNKICPWYYLGVSGVMFAILLFSFIGTYDSFMRVSVSILPFAFFGIAILLNEIQIFLREECKI